MAKTSREVRVRISGELADQVEAYARVAYPDAPLGAVVREALALLVGAEPASAVAWASREAVYTRFSRIARAGLASALRRVSDELDAEEVMVRQDFLRE